MKWSSFRPTGLTKRFHVKVKPLKLQGIYKDQKVEDHEIEGRFVIIELKWEGPNSKSVFFPFYRSSKRHRNYTSQSFLREGDSVEWDDEFESICDFTVLSKDGSFSPWVVSFRVLSGERAESKRKFAVLGKTSLDIAEGAATMESQYERKLPVSLKINGDEIEATLQVNVSFADVRNPLDSPELVQNSGGSGTGDAFFKTVRGITGYKMQRNMENRNQDKQQLGSCESNESVVLDSDTRPGNSGTKLRSCARSEVELDRVQNSGFVSWKKRRLRPGPPKRNAKSGIRKKIRANERVNSDVEVDFDCHISRFSFPDSGSSSSLQNDGTTYFSSGHEGYFNSNNWEFKEIISRDGETILKSDIFFASFDQRSKKASGDSACAVIATSVAHWLHSNRDFFPTKLDFDAIIREGSSLWRNLCNNELYSNSFPDKHFDMETVLEAKLNPITVSTEKSFTGFFSPDKFESLRGTMSFDDIWNEIIKDDINPRIYILSWNDHFFVLKVEKDVCYIIDSLGERLYEGCDKACILKFDGSSLIYEKGGRIICEGKVCCREYVKRFLAKLQVEELEQAEKKGTIDTLYLLRRLQIDFHYTSPSESSSSSLCSSANSSTWSLFSSE